MATSVHFRTPDVQVLDNRGLSVRTVQYLRHPDYPGKTNTLITRRRFSTAGFLLSTADPRLHEAGLANFTYRTDLSGTALRVQGADNGTTLSLSDTAGRPFMTITGIGTGADNKDDKTQAVTRTFQYEVPALPGRLLSVTEKTAGGKSHITDRFVYAGNADAEKALNRAGQCISHYDTAGLVQTDSIALNGAALSVTRRLLKDADNPDGVADWQGKDASAWNDLLDSDTCTTRTTADATGSVLTTTDARGNVQRVAYDMAGQLSGSWLTVKGGVEQPVITSPVYSAPGQALSETQGNGVVTTYVYDPQTLRLTGMTTARPAGHPSGQKVLQDLRYEYDRVGNVLWVHNDAEETQFWRNQKTVPENTYVYDSLYRLVSATGRELAGIAQQGAGTAGPLPVDSSAFVAWRRQYLYDTGDNLTQIKHSAPAAGNNYTTDITVSDRSNRGVLSALAKSPGEVDALFTAGGQQKQLLPGQTLTWTSRSELLKVTPVKRSGGPDDSESYRYDGGSQRILKVSVQKTGNSTQEQRVVYLPGLELRTSMVNGKETESLEVITTGTGRGGVRVLRWQTGKPAAVDPEPVRYSCDDPTVSGGLELDGEGKVISQEEYYPFGGTAVWASRSQTEAEYKTVRYSGKERDATGLYYYGYRYYQPWSGRWLCADPAGTVDGLNLFRMVRNNPTSTIDTDGRIPTRVTKLITRENTSPVVKAFEETYRSPNDGQYRKRSEAQRKQDIKILETLNSPENRKDSPQLEEYIEGGNGIYKVINDHLRGVKRTDNADIRSRNLLSVVTELNNYNDVAYRTLNVPSGVYHEKIKRNDVVMDAGFMSVSALPQNAINWLETWSEQFKNADTKKTILIFDEATPKKMAAGGMLPDHILIQPNTPLKVKEIHTIDGSSDYPELTVVRLKNAKNPFKHDIKDIYSGKIILPTTKVSRFSGISRILHRT